MTDRWTISVPEDVAEEVMAELDWGDSRSEWVTDAIERKLAAGAGAGVDAAAVVAAAGIDDRERAAAELVVEYVAARRVVLKSELKTDVYPEATTDRESAETWYRNVVKPLAEAGVLDRDSHGRVMLAMDGEE